MKIELNEFKVRDIVEGYLDSQEEGVYAYKGKLNIRPKYQREFVYKDEKRAAVVETIQKGFPLNVMYWMKNEDGTFEVLDGQQRTISFCQYIIGEYSIDNKYFHSLTETEKNQILDYKLMIYICEGTDKERLDWFKIINIAGEKLTDQELRNAIYTGPWLTDAKRYFSKTGCAAYQVGEKYLNGTPIRQDYLETVLKWISNNNIEEHMSKKQHDPNANEEWLYFNRVLEWVKNIFFEYRKEMKGLDWGTLYNKFGDQAYDSQVIEKQIQMLMMDDDVSSKKGIYEYILSGDEKHLNIRGFTDSQKRSCYEKQKGICSNCKEKFEINEMEADHITPWYLGGKTTEGNCQMLCRECNRRKGGI